MLAPQTVPFIIIPKAVKSKVKNEGLLDEEAEETDDDDSGGDDEELEDEDDDEDDDESDDEDDDESDEDDEDDEDEESSEDDIAATLTGKKVQDVGDGASSFTESIAVIPLSDIEYTDDRGRVPQSLIRQSRINEIL